MNTCASPRLARIILSVNRGCARGLLACRVCRVVSCRVVDSVASPQSNMAFCVHAAVLPLYGAEQQMEAGGET